MHLARSYFNLCFQDVCVCPRIKLTKSQNFTFDLFVEVLNDILTSLQDQLCISCDYSVNLDFNVFIYFCVPKNSQKI